jgi:2'-5' RNA ligase
VRLFLALDLPADIGLALESWASSALRGRDGARVLPAAALHVTAVFIGQCEAAEIPSIERAAARAVSQATRPRLTVATLDAVPRRRPRLLAVGLRDEGGHAVALHAELTAVLAQSGAELAEGRPYWPHVTVARLRRGGSPTPPRRPLPSLEPFEPPALTLYRSEPGPGGSRYTPLASASFSRSGGSAR